MKNAWLGPNSRQQLSTSGGCNNLWIIGGALLFAAGIGYLASSYDDKDYPNNFYF